MLGRTLMWALDVWADVALDDFEDVFMDDFKSQSEGWGERIIDP